MIRRLTLFARFAPLLLGLLLSRAAPAQDKSARPLVPDHFSLSEAATLAIEAPWLTDIERSEMRVFHGVWKNSDLITPRARAMAALSAWRFDDPVFDDPDAPLELRAQAKLLAGDLNEAISIAGVADSIRAARIHAEALETLGRYDEARQVLAPVIDKLITVRIDDAAELTETVRSLVIRARLTGQPARDYQRMMSLTARVHQDLDRLYWPARLVEAELLLDKHNQREAAAALHETLSLNPRCAEAWYCLGRIALMRFDQDSVRKAHGALRRIDAHHPLAELLHAESQLTQNDPDEALEILADLVYRRPKLRCAHALVAAAHALRYDRQAMQAALGRYDELSPGSAEAYCIAGRYLSKFRQYDEAALLLNEAIRRQGAWPAPRIELGLMEMQTGRDDTAMSMLRQAAELDPFNKEAANSLLLLEELAGYGRLETGHFTIRYKPGIDEVLVAMMPEALEEIHQTVVSRFGFAPPGKTIIELMPDHKRFAVRITGMPGVHTIAACTGPIIALEVPREGKRSLHHGTFDWVRVVRHEYTHTVTLGQTRNRIPRWLTEAAAVEMELAPRAGEDCLMLARAHRKGELFDLDELERAFVRPDKPGDVHKAYEQSWWMLQFMDERFGSQAVIDLLGQFFEGRREAEALKAALGVGRERFLSEFLIWAGGQVRAWGLAPKPSMIELTDQIRRADPDLAIALAASQQAKLDAIVETMVRRIGQPASRGDRQFTAARWPALMRPPVRISDEQLANWRRQYPDHPDIIKEEILRRFDDSGEADESLISLLERYSELRPVDDYPHRKLAQIHLAGSMPCSAIPHLEHLDAREEHSPVYAWRLAQLYRQSGDIERALGKITRAAQINAYDAAYRELAAAIAIEAGRLDLARMHIKALTVLEPNRPQHEKRLKRINEIIEE